MTHRILTSVGVLGLVVAGVFGTGGLVGACSSHSTATPPPSAPATTTTPTTTATSGADAVQRVKATLTAAGGTWDTNYGGGNIYGAYQQLSGWDSHSTNVLDIQWFHTPAAAVAAAAQETGTDLNDYAVGTNVIAVFPQATPGLAAAVAQAVHS